MCIRDRYTQRQIAAQTVELYREVIGTPGPQDEVDG